MGLLLGDSGGTDAGSDARASLEQFVPPGWEVGDCPDSYGRDSVLCASTKEGPFKVDHHVPSAWIRVPRGSCKAVHEAVRRDARRRRFSLLREVAGRCGSPAAPCVEHEFRGRSRDAAGVFAYVLCPPGHDPLVVSYAVSPRVAGHFHEVARLQVHWAEGQVPLLHIDPIQIGTDASLEGVQGDPNLNVVRNHRPEIERCRTDAIAAGRVPVGKLILQWQIGADGRVALAKTVSDETRDPSLAECVLARIRTWEFPLPKGGGSVFITCPFVFRATE